MPRGDGGWTAGYASTRTSSVYAQSSGRGVWSLREWPGAPPAPQRLGAALWLDASVSGSLFSSTTGGSAVSSGGTVQRWEDQSGSGNHVTGVNGPTRSVASVNGRDSLAFSSSLLTRSSLNLSALSNASLFAVIKFAQSGNQIATAFGTDGSYGGLSLEANLRTAGSHSATFGSNLLSTENSAIGGSVTNAFRAYGAVFNRSASTGTLFINGSSTATVTRSTTINSSSGFAVGAYFSSGYSLSGNVCEVCYFAKTLSSNEVSDLHTYFVAKWGL